MKKKNTTVETKRCPKCGQVLPLSAFGKDSRNADGHARYCKECLKVVNNARNHRKQAESARGQLMLQTYSDATLYNELRRRGWRGRLIRPEYIGEPAPAEIAGSPAMTLGVAVKTEL